MTAWIVVICIGIGSLAFRMAPLAFAGRSTSPRTSRVIKDAGAAATAAITVASFDRAAQSGDVVALAVAGAVGFVLALRGRVDAPRRRGRYRPLPRDLLRARLVGTFATTSARAALACSKQHCGRSEP